MGTSLSYLEQWLICALSLFKPRAFAHITETLAPKHALII